MPFLTPIGFAAPPAGRQISSTEKLPFGQFGHVLLTEKEYTQLKEMLGADLCNRAIQYLDIYIGAKVGQNESLAKENHFFTLQLWVLDAVKRKRNGQDFGEEIIETSGTAPAQHNKTVLSGKEISREYIEQQADNNWNAFKARLREHMQASSSKIIAPGEEKIDSPAPSV